MLLFKKTALVALLERFLMTWLRFVLMLQDLYHFFIDFKRAFDRVWRATLWATMKKYNVGSVP